MSCKNSLINLINYYLKKRTFIFVCLLMSFSFLKINAQQDIAKEIEKLIHHETSWDKINPSACVIAMIELDTIFYFSFDHSQYYNIDEHTPFEIGSITKLFTSLFLEDQIANGVIENDQTISEILGKSLHKEADELTIKDLKTHNTGLPKRPMFWGKNQNDADQPFLNYTKEDLQKYFFDFPLKQKFSYSHINYAMLELALNKKLDGNYTDLFNQYLIKKLNLKNSWLFHEREGFLTQGYDRSNVKVKPYIFSSFAASEGMRSTCYDLAKFAQNKLRKSDVDLGTKHSDTYEYTKDINFKYPWFKLKIRKSTNIYSFAGKSEGHNAQLFLYPETGTGVVLLANGSSGIPFLALNILRMMNQEWKRKAN